MNFEELQKSWHSQPVTLSENNAAIEERMIGRWRKQQRTVLWSNIATTIGFVGVFFVFGKVFASFHAGHSAFFGGSMLAMVAVMLMYLVVAWKGFASRKIDHSIAIRKYLDSYSKALQWRRKLITTYNWVYAVLLWASLMCYILDVTHGGSMLLQIGAPAITTAYIFGVIFITRYTKGKKQLLNIDELMADINLLKEKMEE
jgi:hypothetical protein